MFQFFLSFAQDSLPLMAHALSCKRSPPRTRAHYFTCIVFVGWTRSRFSLAFMYTRASKLPRNRCANVVGIHCFSERLEFKFFKTGHPLALALAGHMFTLCGHKMVSGISYTFIKNYISISILKVFWITVTSHNVPSVLQIVEGRTCEQILSRKASRAEQAWEQNEKASNWLWQFGVDFKISVHCDLLWSSGVT